MDKDGVASTPCGVMQRCIGGHLHVVVPSHQATDLSLLARGVRTAARDRIATHLLDKTIAIDPRSFVVIIRHLNHPYVDGHRPVHRPEYQQLRPLHIEAKKVDLL